MLNKIDINKKKCLWKWSKHSWKLNLPRCSIRNSIRTKGALRENFNTKARNFDKRCYRFLIGLFVFFYKTRTILSNTKFNRVMFGKIELKIDSVISKNHTSTVTTVKKLQISVRSEFISINQQYRITNDNCFEMDPSRLASTPSIRSVRIGNPGHPCRAINKVGISKTFVCLGLLNLRL